MAKKYFTFVDRFVPVEFFEENPVTITLCISDAMSQKIDAGLKKLQQSLTVDQTRDILVSWIGTENAEALLSRAEEVDVYTVAQLLCYIKEAYVEGRSKNLVAAAAGRRKK